MPTRPRPTILGPYIGAQQPALKSEDKSAEQFVARANLEEIDDLEAFCWDGSDENHRHSEPYFNLSLAD